MTNDIRTHGIKTYAEAAFKRIRDLGIAPTPDVFDFFYLYESGEVAGIREAYDSLCARGFQITTEIVADLHRNLVDRAGGSTELVLRAEKIVAKTITEVNAAVKTVDSNASAYAGIVDAGRTALERAQNTEQYKRVALNTIEEAHRVIEDNNAIVEKLLQSTKIMKDLLVEVSAARKDAITDALTGLLNRKHFDVTLPEIIRSVHKNDIAFSIIIFDIDHFKSYNDKYGHAVGDQVIKLVAKTLSSVAPETAHCIRFGGEEFIVLLPGATLEDARELAETIRESVMRKELRSRDSGELLGKVTISAGVAQIGRNETGDRILDRADAALYQAKEAGRNLVKLAEPPKQTKIAYSD